MFYYRYYCVLKGAYTCCAAGYYLPEGQSTCLICPVGKYAEAGAKECIMCEGGKYAQSGAGSCTACETGKNSYVSIFVIFLFFLTLILSCIYRITQVYVVGSENMLLLERLVAAVVR